MKAQVQKGKLKWENNNRPFMTRREFNEITNFGEKIKTARDYEFIARQRWHKNSDELALLFKYAHKNTNIKAHWIAKNVIGIYHYHRRERCARANTKAERSNLE